MKPLDQSDIDVPEPEDLGPKEVYAFFGLASYHSQVLERGLVHLAAFLRIHGAKADLQRGSRGALPDSWDGLVAPLEKRTFGQLLRRHEKRIPSDLCALLEDALDQRNRLIHAFFWDHAENFMSEHGRTMMIEELREMARLFIRANREADVRLQSLMTDMGIDQADIQAEFDQLKEEASREPDAT